MSNHVPDKWLEDGDKIAVAVHIEQDFIDFLKASGGVRNENYDRNVLGYFRRYFLLSFFLKFFGADNTDNKDDGMKYIKKKIIEIAKRIEAEKGAGLEMNTASILDNKHVCCGAESNNYCCVMNEERTCLEKSGGLDFLTRDDFIDKISNNSNNNNNASDGRGIPIKNEEFNNSLCKLCIEAVTNPTTPPTPTKRCEHPGCLKDAVKYDENNSSTTPVVPSLNCICTNYCKECFSAILLKKFPDTKVLEENPTLPCPLCEKTNFYCRGMKHVHGGCAAADAKRLPNKRRAYDGRHCESCHNIFNEIVKDNSRRESIIFSRNCAGTKKGKAVGIKKRGTYKGHPIQATENEMPGEYRSDYYKELITDDESDLGGDMDTTAPCVDSDPTADRFLLQPKGCFLCLSLSVMSFDYYLKFCPSDDRKKICTAVATIADFTFWLDKKTKRGFCNDQTNGAVAKFVKETFSEPILDAFKKSFNKFGTFERAKNFNNDGVCLECFEFFFCTILENGTLWNEAGLSENDVTFKSISNKPKTRQNKNRRKVSHEYVICIMENKNLKALKEKIGAAFAKLVVQRFVEVRTRSVCDNQCLPKGTQNIHANMIVGSHYLGNRNVNRQVQKTDIKKYFSVLPKSIENGPRCRRYVICWSRWSDYKTTTKAMGFKFFNIEQIAFYANKKLVLRNQTEWRLIPGKGPILTLPEFFAKFGPSCCSLFLGSHQRDEFDIPGAFPCVETITAILVADSKDNIDSNVTIMIDSPIDLGGTTEVLIQFAMSFPQELRKRVHVLSKHFPNVGGSGVGDNLPSTTVPGVFSLEDLLQVVLYRRVTKLELERVIEKFNNDNRSDSSSMVIRDDIIRFLSCAEQQQYFLLNRNSKKQRRQENPKLNDELYSSQRTTDSAKLKKKNKRSSLSSHDSVRDEDEADTENVFILQLEKSPIKGKKISKENKKAFTVDEIKSAMNNSRQYFSKGSIAKFAEKHKQEEEGFKEEEEEEEESDSEEDY